MWRDMEVNSILKWAGVQWAALLKAEKRAGSTAWGGDGLQVSAGQEAGRCSFAWLSWKPQVSMLQRARCPLPATR